MLCQSPNSREGGENGRQENKIYSGGGQSFHLSGVKSFTGLHVPGQWDCGFHSLRTQCFNFLWKQSGAKQAQCEGQHGPLVSCFGVRYGDVLNLKPFDVI